MANLTLFDLITLQRNDTLTGLVEDVTTYAPEFSVFPAVPRSGINYEIVRRTAYPTAQFRIVGQGATPSKSAYKKEIKEMFFVDVPLQVDEAVLKADDKSTGDVWQHEAKGVLQNTLILLGAQVYYGTSNDANGYLGLRTQTAGVVSAGGTTNSTSAYLCWMDAAWGCRFDVGQNGSISLPPPVKQQIVDPNTSTKVLMAWVSNLSCWIAFNVVSNAGTWAVSGITAHQTSSLYDQAFTDSLAAKLISNIPVARRNNLRWFINRTTAWLLQQSRSTINVPSNYSLQSADAGGHPAWSPRPDACEGYPITMTDSITNTESN